MWRSKLALPALMILLIFAGCSGGGEHEEAAEEETLARTEFTGRIENFFEYEPLKSGRPSRFLIHLTDLDDGSPVEQAEVTLSIRPSGGAARTTARVGRVTGIYVAEVTIPKAGDYDIEFSVKAAKLDERMQLTGFKVE